MKNTNIQDALMKERDIWIRGKFIAIDFKKYHEEIYKIFGNKFQVSDISYLTNPTEEQKLEAVIDNPANIAWIKNASEQLEIAAIDTMFKKRNMTAMFDLKNPNAMRYAITKDPYQIRNMNGNYTTPELKKYAKKLQDEGIANSLLKKFGNR